MKKLVIVLALAAAIYGGRILWWRSQPVPSRMATALAQAKKENRLVLLDFTGSDWCGWCMKLEEETLSKPEFVNYGSKYLVPLVVDFPHQRKLPADVKAANDILAKRFDVTGFPTLVALDPDGHEVWRHTGFLDGGPKNLISQLDQARLDLKLPAPTGAPAAAAENVAANTKSAPAASAPQAAPQAAATTTTTTNDTLANAPKLQGIFYSRANPSIILGGWRCGEGETVSGMKVVKILQRSVTVEWQGRTRELSLQ